MIFMRIRMKWTNETILPPPPKKKAGESCKVLDACMFLLICPDPEQALNIASESGWAQNDSRIAAEFSKICVLLRL